MKYLRLYVDDAGESRFEDVEVATSQRDFAPPAGPIAVSEAEPARALLFLTLPAGWDDVVHPSPRRQMLVCLAGRARVTASDGSTREVGRGELWLMEDTTGKGHHTRAIGAEDFRAAIVQLD